MRFAISVHFDRRKPISSAHFHRGLRRPTDGPRRRRGTAASTRALFPSVALDADASPWRRTIRSITALGGFVVVKAAVAGGVAALGDVAWRGGRGDPIPDRGAAGTLSDKTGTLIEEGLHPEVRCPPAVLEGVRNRKGGVGL